MFSARNSHDNAPGKSSPQALTENHNVVPSFSPGLPRDLARRNNVQAAAAATLGNHGNRPLLIAKPRASAKLMCGSELNAQNSKLAATGNSLVPPLSQTLHKLQIRPENKGLPTDYKPSQTKNIDLHSSDWGLPRNSQAKAGGRHAVTANFLSYANPRAPAPTYASLPHHPIFFSFHLPGGGHAMGHSRLFKSVHAYSSVFRPLGGVSLWYGDGLAMPKHREVRWPRRSRSNLSQSKSYQAAASPTFLRNNILLFFITMLCNVQQSRQRMECGASAPPIGAVCPNLHFTCLP
jgi:hypothetical protein